MEAGRIVRRSLVACMGIAAACVVGASALGRPLIGVTLAVGLLIGAGNAQITKRLVQTGLPLASTSLVRLITVSSLAVGVGLIVGFERVWLIVLGVGVAQLILASSALVEATRR